MSTAAPTADGHPPRARLSGRRVLLVTLVILLVAVIPGVVLPTLVCRREPPPLDDLGTVPPLALVDHTGAPFTDDALRGHPTIVNFIFTRCDTVCPATTLRMAHIAELTGDPRGEGIKLVSFSVDPGHDTPEVLAAYAAKVHADASRWRFVTGEVAAVRAVVEGALLTSMDNRGVTATGAPDIVHGERFLLIDGDLRIRGAYDTREAPRMDAMIRAARYLLRTQR
ncbi:MAG: SCO family protein [Kofleriaceae bacterium]